MLELRNVSKLYRSGDVETTALDRIDFHVDSGEYVAIMGPSGCGKSTLLSILGMIDYPSQGDYIFEGQNVARWNEGKLSSWRRGRIGFIFQNFNLLDDLTVAENVALALEYSGVPVHGRNALVTEMLTKLGVHHRANHKPSQLSGGQQQRVAIARALVTRPRLLLADEPTGNLDSAHGSEVMRFLHDINRDGTALVMVTHSLENASRASRVVGLLDGRILVDPPAA